MKGEDEGDKDHEDKSKPEEGEKCIEERGGGGGEE